ncbi:hypothetical protein QT937_009070, partial [Xanthomonas campestris pv. campestris]|uniref:hypothetical protein n=1 Tax=Xanthomonas campestris TaxID=339 RepID=UPI00358EFD93
LTRATVRGRRPKFRWERGSQHPSADRSQHAVRQSKTVSNMQANALNAKGDRIAAVAFVVA